MSAFFLYYTFVQKMYEVSFLIKMNNIHETELILTKVKWQIISNALSVW
jgi:hypothetical protein